MTVYLDTSVVASALLHDEDGPRATTLLSRLEPGALCLSPWTGVELFSVIASRVRMRATRPRDALAARLFYREEMAAKARMLTVTAQDYVDAEYLLENDMLTLRSGDALHLAIARRHGISEFCTFDKGLLKAAKVLGITTVDR